MTDKQRMLRRINAAFDDAGGLLTIDDLIHLARQHRVFLAHRNETMVAAEILEYPQKAVCNCFLAAGDLADVLALEAEVEAFARAQGAACMVTHGRRAWSRIGEKTGWQPRSIEFVKWLRPLNGGQA